MPPTNSLSTARVLILQRDTLDQRTTTFKYSNFNPIFLWYLFELDLDYIIPLLAQKLSSKSGVTLGAETPLLYQLPFFAFLILLLSTKIVSHATEVTHI